MRQVRKSPKRQTVISWIDEVHEWFPVPSELAIRTYDWLERPFVAPPIDFPVIDVYREEEVVSIYDINRAYLDTQDIEDLNQTAGFWQTACSSLSPNDFKWFVAGLSEVTKSRQQRRNDGPQESSQQAS